MAKEFEIKELGKLKYFLGIEVTYSKLEIFISHQMYIVDLLKDDGKLAYKLVNTSVDSNHKLRKAKRDIVFDKELHQRLVGKFNYLSHSRPDIAYAMSILSQFMHDWG